MKDLRTLKSLPNTKISKLLLEEHNLSVLYKSVGRILEDVERDKREMINLKTESWLWRVKKLSFIINNEFWDDPVTHYFKTL